MPSYSISDIREDYLKETGVTKAVREALKGLFSERRLPDNPYLHLASHFDAFVDHTPLWKQSSSSLASDVDRRVGTIEVLHPSISVCKHAGTSHAFGLPHLLRLVSKEAAEVLHEVLTEGMPYTFFPTSLPFHTKDGYEVRAIALIQGSSVTWQPDWGPFPEINVRVDVSVTGQRLEEAVHILLDQVLTDLEDIHQVPVNFVDGLSFIDPPSQSNDKGGAGGKGSLSQFFSLADIYVQDEQNKEFEKTALRLVLGNKCIQVRCVTLIDVSSAAEKIKRNNEDAPSEVNADTSKSKLLFKVATKTYFFHYTSLEESRVGYEQQQHYATLPYAALYEGYFTTALSARDLSLYGALSDHGEGEEGLAQKSGEVGGSGWGSLGAMKFKSPKGEVGQEATSRSTEATRYPYSRVNLEANLGSLRRQVERSLHDKNSLEAYRQTLLLVMLCDDRVTGASPLEQGSIRSLEEACSSRDRPDLILSTIPDLVRILNSMSNTLDCALKEMRAITFVARAWPLRVQGLKSSAAGDFADLFAPNGDKGGVREDEEGRPGTADSRATLRTPEVDNATLKWVRTFDMESRILSQLITLKKTAMDLTTAGGLEARAPFSGFSVVIRMVMRDIPDTMPRAGASSLLYRLIRPVHHSVMLLNAISLTISHGFLGRCKNVAWALTHLGVSLASKVSGVSPLASHESHGQSSQGVGAVASMTDDGMFIPDWVLDVKEVESSQVKSGQLPEKISLEGVMLQYAVDTHLDELLSSIWLEVSQPPMSLNPFPKLMSMIRSHGTRMELWRDTCDEAMEALSNDLSLLRPPCFMYAARPSQSSLNLIRKLSVEIGASAGAGGGGGGGGLVDEEAWVVYGSYCAVALADPRALQDLKTSLGDLVEPRDWKKGAYEGEVVPCFTGDAFLTKALKLDDMAEWTAAVRAGLFGRRRGAMPAAFEHPRFYTLEAEEHHLVQGPEKRPAVDNFANEVLDALERIHKTSTPQQHVVGTLQVVQPSPPSSLSSIKGRDASLSIPPHLEFDMSDILDPGRRPVVHKALVEAALKVKEGTRMATVVIYVSAPREGVYVPLKRHLTFTHGLPVTLLFHNLAMEATDGAIHDAGLGYLSQRPSTADRDRLFWDRGVYTRLFLDEKGLHKALNPNPPLDNQSAMLWYSWNTDKGDPCQPFQYHHMVRECMEETKGLMSQGRVLEVLKSMLLCATAVQDDQGIFRFSKCCLSTAQELQTLTEMNKLLVDLMDSSAPQGSRAPVENEKLRATFLTYYSRMTRALSNPKYNYFSGLSILAPPQLDDLHQSILSEFKLGPKERSIFDALNVWTTACEISVANALLDCFGDLEAVRAKIAKGQ